MNSKKLTLYRWRKKILILCAAIPLLQTTGTCDPFALNSFFASQVGSDIAWGVFSTVVRTGISTALQFFPGANVLNILLGGNPTPFYTG